MAGLYRKAHGRPERRSKLIINMPASELDRVDAWGVAAEMPSRTEAVRKLIAAGLDAMSAVRANASAEQAPSSTE